MGRSKLTVEVVSRANTDAAVTVVRIAGALDVTSAEEARASLARVAAEERGTFVLDLADLDFIDSLGIGTILETQLTLKRRGDRIYLTNPRLSIRRAFDVVHALPQHAIFHSREALDAYLRAVQGDDDESGS